MNVNSQVKPKKKGLPKVVAVFLAVAITATVGTAGIVQARADLNGLTKKEQCKDGEWRKYGFKNQGQCVSFVAHLHGGNGNGGGYGNGNGNNNPIDIDLELNNSNGNVINIIIRYVFG